MKTAHDLVAAAKARVAEVTLGEAEQAIRDADVLVDVREADEFAAGHLPGAVHISRGLLEFRFSGMPRCNRATSRWCCTARPAAEPLWPVRRCRTWATSMCRTLPAVLMPG